MKRSAKDWLIVLASLSDEAAVALLIVLILRLFKIPITPSIIALLIAFFASAAAIMHLLVIPAFHKKVTTGKEGMIGLEGRVVEALNPDGLILVSGEYWKAKSVERSIAAGEKVEILGLNGLVLKVKPVNPATR
jgi:membrane-bound ClpP family serine protease